MCWCYDRMDSCKGVALISAARIWGEHLCEFLVWMIGTESQSLSQNSFFMVEMWLYPMPCIYANQITRCQPQVNRSETSIVQIYHSYIVSHFRTQRKTPTIYQLPHHVPTQLCFFFLDFFMSGDAKIADASRFPWPHFAWWCLAISSSVMPCTGINGSSKTCTATPASAWCSTASWWSRSPWLLAWDQKCSAAQGWEQHSHYRIRWI